MSDEISRELDSIRRVIENVNVSVDLDAIVDQLDSIRLSLCDEDETPTRIACALERIADALEKVPLPVAKNKKTL